MVNEMQLVGTLVSVKNQLEEKQSEQRKKLASGELSMEEQRDMFIEVMQDRGAIGMVESILDMVRDGKLD